MRPFLRPFVDKLRFQAEQSRHYSERHLKLFGAIAVILVPLTTFVEYLVVDPVFDTVYVRIAAATAGLLLLFHERLPMCLLRHMALIWVAVAAFVLPFCFGAILTFNAALTPAGEPPAPIWVYQYLVALFIFIQLMNYGLLCVASWLVATAPLACVYLIVQEPNHSALIAAWVYPFPVYLTALLIGSVTNRNVHMVQSEQLRAASAIGSNIAHELRTPLASIRALAHGTSRFLPGLVDAFERAREAGIPVSLISSHQIDQLRESLSSIQTEVSYSNTMIDMLLVNTSDIRMSREEFQTFRISDVIHDAVSRFPFNSTREREMLKAVVEDDFCVHAPKLLLVHVLFNLIKNGLYYAQKNRSGSLVLEAREHLGKHVVTITDTGPGIPVQLQARIFERFFSTAYSAQGAGIGLSFCRTVMDAIGGSIDCESREGEYTTFKLTFPMAN